MELGSESRIDAIRDTLRRFSGDRTVHGIILQTPLPPGVDVAEAASVIDPAKDVDGANPESLGRLAAGPPAFPPATAAAVLALLDHHDVELAGRHAVLVGRPRGHPSQVIERRDEGRLRCAVALARPSGTDELLVSQQRRRSLRVRPTMSRSLRLRPTTRDTPRQHSGAGPSQKGSAHLC